MKVLVVEDLAIMRKVIVHTLEDIGYDTISQASNGVEALAMIEAETFDLIILDWIMPVMDGLTLAKILRKTKKHKDLPIIMLTSMNDKENFFDAMNAKIDDYIVKPFNSQSFKEKVDKVMLKHSTEASS